MPIYETVIIAKPQLSDAEITGLVDKTKKILTSDGGEILNEDKWGRRKLAYPIKHSREGFYVYLKYQAPEAAVVKLGGQFRVMDTLLRTMTIRPQIRKPLVKK